MLETGGAGPAIARLLDIQPPSLSAWYGDPVSTDAAQALALLAEHELRARLCAGGACFQLHVLLLICRFWLQGGSELDYEQLAAATGNERELALLELVYGQLLTSRKYRQARRHLDRGFSLAVDYLDPSGYFRLLRRHELLGYLALSSKPAPPLGLEPLLREAGVIKTLQADASRPHECLHQDTVG